ncbi:MAG: putative ABC transporter permease [Clostridia bacterium]|nr:putative ABC transporter permease [Clostridia bacterium]
MERGVKRQNEGGMYALSAKYFLLFMLISFFGWGFEVLLMRVLYGEWFDRGWMQLPFCPIYGSSVMAIYFLLGTPDEPRGILRGITGRTKCILAYLFFAFLIPTLAELIVGAFFDEVMHRELWTYVGLPFSFRGYISLPVSLGWMGLIFVFMKWLFPFLRKAILRIPNGVATLLASVLLLVSVADVYYSFFVNR